MNGTGKGFYGRWKEWQVLDPFNPAHNPTTSLFQPLHNPPFTLTPLRSPTDHEPTPGRWMRRAGEHRGNRGTREKSIQDIVLPLWEVFCRVNSLSISFLATRLTFLTIIIVPFGHWTYKLLIRNNRSNRKVNPVGRQSMSSAITSQRWI